MLNQFQIFIITIAWPVANEEEVKEAHVAQYGHNAALAQWLIGWNLVLLQVVHFG